MVSSVTELDPTLPDPLHRQLADQLIHAIRSGELRPGDALPSEHALRRRFSVSRVTVRAALDRLDTMGLITRRRGRGTFVRATDSSGSAESAESRGSAGSADRGGAGDRDADGSPVGESASEAGRGHDRVPPRGENRIALVLANTLGSGMSMLIDDVDAVVRSRGFRLDLAVSRDRFDIERAALQRLIADPPAGVLLYTVDLRGSANPNCYHYLRLQELGIPLLMMDRYVPQAPIGYVALDDHAAIGMLTRHVLERNRRDVMYVTADSEVTSVRDRNQGFIDTMLEAGVMPHSIVRAPQRRQPLDDVDLAEAAVREMLGEADGAVPDAVVACNSYFAIGACRALRRHGLEIPDDVVVCGFEDVPEAALLDVPLTVLKPPEPRMGQVAADQLIRMIRDAEGHAETVSEPIAIRLPVELVARGSTRPGVRTGTRVERATSSHR